MKVGLLRSLIADDEKCRNQANALRRLMSRRKHPVNADNLHALFDSADNRTDTVREASLPPPNTSRPMPVPIRRNFDDVDSSSDEDGARNHPPLVPESFDDGETMSKFFTQSAAATPEVPLQDDDDHAVATLTAKYAALSQRDAVNQRAFQREMKAAMPEMVANIERCFRDAKTKLGGSAPDDAIREEVTRQIWSHKMLEVHNRIGGAATGDPPEQYRSDRAAALFMPLHAEELQRQGYTVIEDCLTSHDLAALQEDIAQLQRTGKLKATVQKDLGTRDDHIGWFSEAEVSAPSLRRAVLLQKGMAMELKNALGLPLRVPSRVMCSCYPGDGARYVPHRDNSASTAAAARHPSSGSSTSGNKVSTHNNLRELTCILYMNPADWDAARDGGCLRLHVAAGLHGRTGCAHDCTEGSGGCHVDVVPSAGRMVLFKSRQVLHEVLPAHRSRLAMTLWLFGEPTSA